MMLVCASTAGGGRSNLSSEGSGAGCARAGRTTSMVPAKSENTNLRFFIVLPLFEILFWIVAPQPFQRGGQGLHHHPVVDMSRTHGEDIAMVVTLLLQHRRHTVVGQRPVVPSLFGIIEAVVLFAHFHPDADGLLCCLGNQIGVI